jgi:uncharacterized delta-60 repeat protein
VRIPLGTVDSGNGVGVEGATPYAGPGETIFVIGTVQDSGQVTEHMFALRLRSDGTLDPTFGSGGAATPIAPSSAGASGARAAVAAVQGDGSCLIGGALDLALDGGGASTTAFLVRLNGDGTLDGSFGQGGVVLPPVPATVRGMAVQSDGKILVSFDGTQSLARYAATGAVDTSFGSGGYVGSPPYGALGLQLDGRVLVSGVDPDSEVLSVARYSSAGVLDASFASGGNAQLDVLSTRLVLQTNGAIVLGGATSAASSSLVATLTRLDSGGARDATFGTGGVAKTSLAASYLSGLGLESDGKIVVATNEVLVTRFLASGALDSAFGSMGSVAGGPLIASGAGLAVEPDDTIVLAGVEAGSSGLFVARVTP